MASGGAGRKVVESRSVDLSLLSDEVKKRASRVKLVLMDVDGVLTDGTLYYFPGRQTHRV